MNDQDYMRRAIELAKKGEGWCHPNPMVGAVIVKSGRIIGEGYHARCGELHAERNAIASLRESAEGATIYVTLEPCPMCAGAIINARIPQVVYGAADPKNGACGSVCDLFSMEFNHHPQLRTGVREEQCAAVLTDFFQQLRTQLQTRPKWRKKPE